MVYFTLLAIVDIGVCSPLHFNFLLEDHFILLSTHVALTLPSGEDHALG